MSKHQKSIYLKHTGYSSSNNSFWQYHLPILMMFKSLTISIWITSYNVASMRSISSSFADGCTDILRIKFYISTNWRRWFSSFSDRLITDESCRVAYGPLHRRRQTRWCRSIIAYCWCIPACVQCWKVSINDILDKFRCFRFNCYSARCSMRYYPAQRQSALVRTRSDFLFWKKDIVFPTEWTAVVAANESSAAWPYIARHRVINYSERVRAVKRTSCL